MIKESENIDEKMDKAYMSDWLSSISTGKRVKILVPKHDNDHDTMSKVLLRCTAAGKNNGHNARNMKQTERIPRLK